MKFVDQYSGDLRPCEQGTAIGCAGGNEIERLLGEDAVETLEVAVGAGGHAENVAAVVDRGYDYKTTLVVAAVGDRGYILHRRTWFSLCRPHGPGWRDTDHQRAQSDEK